MIDDDKKTIVLGMIAQEVEVFIPELVKEAILNRTNSEVGLYKSLNYTGLIPVIIESIKELKSHLDEQREMIFELKAQMNKNN